uniref:Uncharacterized protein n=1 Tax=Strongyloides venezuelensis TaxID=75913 RepID=A0A0K0EZ45_STRVS
MHILRNFGMSRTIMQDKIHLVIQDFYEHLDNLEDKDNVNISKVIQLSVGNVINLILFGFMYTHTDNDDFFEFAKTLECSLKETNILGIKLLTMFPVLDNIPILSDFLHKRIIEKKYKMRTNEDSI